MNKLEYVIESKHKQPSNLKGTGISIKLRKAFKAVEKNDLIAHVHYAIELTVYGEFWVVFRRYGQMHDNRKSQIRKYPMLYVEKFPRKSYLEKEQVL
jgi:hypothetical protein